MTLLVTPSSLAAPPRPTRGLLPLIGNTPRDSDQELDDYDDPPSK